MFNPPRFYTQKRVGKNVPIPKIENFTSLNNNNNNHEIESKTSTFAPIAVSVAPTTTTTDVNQNQNQAALQPQIENNKMDEEYPTNTINSNDYAITSLWSNTSSSSDLPSTKCLVFTLLKDSVLEIEFEKNRDGCDESNLSLNTITAFEWINQGI